MARYTPEQESVLRDTYLKEPNNSVDELAHAMGVSRRSIIAKLSSMGLYKRKGYRTKSGELPVKKATIADHLGEVLNLQEHEVEQLEKLSKPLLKKLTDIFERSFHEQE